MIPVVKPILGKEEVDAVLAVLRSGQIAQGARVAELELRFAAALGVAHPVAASSGTASPHLNLLAHGIGPRDEEISSPFTYVASANAAFYLGYRARLPEAERASREVLCLPVHPALSEAELACVGREVSALC